MNVRVEHAPSRFALRLGIGRVLAACVALGALATIAGFLGRWWWLLELFSHFRVQYLFGLALLAAMLGLLRKAKLALLAGGLAAVNAALVLPLYFGPPRPAEVHHVRTMLINVNSTNHHHQRVMDVIRAEDPDLFVLLEVTDEWIQALDTLGKRYPHHISRPRSDNFGIAMFSRLMAEQMKVREVGFPVPSIFARLRTDRGAITVIATHPPPPAGFELAAGRNRQLATVAEAAANPPGARILLGDLNLTSWSPHFDDVLERSGLRDSRQGFGVQPTWPDGSLLMQIPIDHCLVSKELSVLDHRIGPSIGSDHRPVIVDLRFVDPHEQR